VSRFSACRKSTGSNNKNAEHSTTAANNFREKLSAATIQMRSILTTAVSNFLLAENYIFSLVLKFFV